MARVERVNTHLKNAGDRKDLVLAMRLGQVLQYFYPKDNTSLYTEEACAFRIVPLRRISRYVAHRANEGFPRLGTANSRRSAVLHPLGVVAHFCILVLQHIWHRMRCPKAWQYNTL